MKIHSYHFKKRRRGLQKPREMEIVHIHRKLLGCYCLALRVRRGGLDKQQMTNVQNCKWVSGNLLRRGQVSRLCCTLQYVLWTVREAQLSTISPGRKTLPMDKTSRYKGLVLICFFFSPSCLFVFLLTYWLPGWFGKISIKPLNQRISNFSKAW